MQKIRLFTPGPTPVFPSALKAMSKPMIHHRSADFMTMLQEVREGLKYILGTKQEVLILSSSGTGAMEGAIANLFSPNDQVIVVRAGKFGERWGEIASAYHLEVVYLDIPWGEAPSLSKIREICERCPNAKGIFVQGCETSTGVDFPIEEMASFTKTKKVLLIVDAISSLGVSALEMDQWGVDVVVSASQKGLMLPPGLSFVCFNDRAWERQKHSTLPKYYFDLSKELKSIVKNQTAYTPAVSLINGLGEVLNYFKEETKEKIFDRYKTFSFAMRAAVTDLQLELFAKHPSQGLVSVCVPENIDGKKIVQLMRDEHRMMIAGGQGDMSGKIIRISCIGHADPFDLISVFSALEKVLKSQGAKIEFGKGVSRLEAELLGE